MNRNGSTLTVIDLRIFMANSNTYQKSFPADKCMFRINNFVIKQKVTI